MKNKKYNTNLERNVCIETLGEVQGLILDLVFEYNKPGSKWQARPRAIKMDVLNEMNERIESMKRLAEAG